MRRFDAARERAARLGPVLFPPGAPRWIAASIITGTPLEPPPDMDPAIHSEICSIVREMSLSSLPHVEEWAVYLVNLLAEQRHLPLLSGSLRWAADEVERRRPLCWVRRKVQEAFDLAQGVDAETSAEFFVRSGP
ncbi:MAG: hypothetical protein AB7N65_01710 [Vicinamibacterales bacterium]